MQLPLRVRIVLFGGKGVQVIYSVNVSLHVRYHTLIHEVQLTPFYSIQFTLDCILFSLPRHIAGSLILLCTAFTWRHNRAEPSEAVKAS